MSKTFLLYFEDTNVDGGKIMEALKRVKGYHHVQDLSGLPEIADAAQEIAALRADLAAMQAERDGLKIAAENAIRRLQDVEHFLGWNNQQWIDDLRNAAALGQRTAAGEE